VDTVPISARAASVSTAALFLGFLKVGLTGFGGVLPFARRMLVEERRWLSESEFNEVLSLAQFLPGPNIVNVTVIVGRRHHGIPGALAATAGLMLMPLVIVLALATVYARFAQLDPVRGACTGISAAAAGLILSMGCKMARALRRSTWQIGIAAIVFVAIGVLRVPLLWTLAAMVPIAVAIAWRTR
jgi:chromate transporter